MKLKNIHFLDGVPLKGYVHVASLVILNFAPKTKKSIVGKSSD